MEKGSARENRRLELEGWPMGRLVAVWSVAVKLSREKRLYTAEMDKAGIIEQILSIEHPQPAEGQ